MGYLSHAFSSQSQATHIQPNFHGCSWPPALRPQGRLSGRIFRLRSSYPSTPNLRGRLRSSASRRCRSRARFGNNIIFQRNLALSPKISPTRDRSRNRHASTHDSQIASIRSRPPRPDLTVTLRSKVSEFQRFQCFKDKNQRRNHNPNPKGTLLL